MSEKGRAGMSAKALFIGGGNMAQAIIGGAIEAKVTPPTDWVVVDPNADKRAMFEGWGALAAPDIPSAMALAGGRAEVWFGVKPQVFTQMGPELSEMSGRVVVSIMAGVTTASLHRALGSGTRPIRVMPNTPVRVRKGMSAISLGNGASRADAVFARSVFSGVGDVIELPEDLIDAFTGVAGSGPAYLFYVAEAMIQGACDVGMASEDASRVVGALFEGASALLKNSEQTPEALRKAVTSPAGTTAAGVAALEEAKVNEAFMRAIKAARDRGRALGGAG